MFEHVGFKDLCISLWKYRHGILSVSLVVTLVFGLVTFLRPSSSDTANQDPYYVRENIVCFKNGNTAQEATGGDYSAINLAVMYSDLLVRDTVVNTMIDNMEGKYSRVKINKIYNNTFGESLDIKERILPEQFSKFITVSLLSGNMGIKIHVESKNKQFSDDLMRMCMDYMRKSVKNIDDGITVETISNYSTQKSVVDDGSNGISSVTKDKKVQTALVFIITFVLLCLCVFVKILIVPTVNRAADFENLGVSVLGEIKGE